jgi:hypothetical protein
VSPIVPEAPRGKAQNKRPACALSAILWRVGPSTRGATAPQRAQQVNFVVRRYNSLSNAPGFIFATIRINNLSLDNNLTSFFTYSK